MASWLDEWNQKRASDLTAIRERRDNLLAKEQKRKQELDKQSRLSAKKLDAATAEQVQLNSEQKTQFAIALFAIGFAASNIDGQISLDEKRELAHFIHEYHPEMTKALEEKIRLYKQNPPTLKQALEEIDRLSTPDFALFRRLIALIINADDGTSTKEEIKFLNEFDAYVNSRA